MRKWKELKKNLIWETNNMSQDDQELHADLFNLQTCVKNDQFGAGGDKVIAAMELEKLHQDLRLLFLCQKKSIH